MGQPLTPIQRRRALRLGLVIAVIWVVGYLCHGAAMIAVRVYVRLARRLKVKVGNWLNSSGSVYSNLRALLSVLG